MSNLRNSNEIFTKHVTYDNINSQKNQGFTFSLENTCWKNHSGGSNWPPSHFTVNRKFSSYDLSLLHILRFKYNSNNRFFSTICFQVLIRPNKYFKQKYSKYFQGWNGIFFFFFFFFFFYQEKKKKKKMISLCMTSRVRTSLNSFFREFITYLIAINSQWPFSTTRVYGRAKPFCRSFLSRHRSSYFEKWSNARVVFIQTQVFRYSLLKDQRRN